MMKKYIEWISSHKASLFICMGVLFFLPIVIVHLLFKWNSGIEFWVAEWGAGEVLGYVGTMLTFIGTMVLSFLALQASNKANELSTKVIEMEKDRYRLELRPFVLVSNWKAYNIGVQELIDEPQKKYIQIGTYSTGTALGIALELTNTTNSHVTVEYSGGMTRNPDQRWKNSAVNQENLKMILAPGESDEFVFYAERSFIEQQKGKKVTIELILENRFSKRYKEKFVIIITSLSDNVGVTPGKWYCNLFAQEYTIGRFEKDVEGNIICVEEEL